MITQIHHKKNELFEVEFYKDKECTKAFDFKDTEDLYIELINGDLSPLFKIMSDETHNFYISYLYNLGYSLPDNFHTLDSITPSLSKYIPEDNAVLFLSGEELMKNRDSFYGKSEKRHYHYIELMDSDMYTVFPKQTIFLSHGTQSELQKAEEVVKELKEKYGVKEVNLFVLHWFDKELYELIQNKNGSYTSVLKYQNFNKIITTNSTSILKPEDSNERLQVIDCKEIFEENLNGTI